MKEGRQLVSDKKRQSTDVICLILFTFFTIAMLMAGIYSYIKGSTSKYRVPYDSDGRGCGLDYPGYSYIYFPSPQVDSLWITTCVKACPTENDKAVECQTNSVVTSCAQNNSADNTKAFHIYDTVTFRGSICLPVAETIKDRVLGAIGSHFLEEMFGSILKDWTLLLLVIPIAALVSLVSVILIRVIAGYVIYLFYAFIILAFIGFGIYLVLPVENRNEKTFVLKQNQPLAIGISAVCFILSIAMLFLFISYRDTIRQTVSYIDKTNAFFKNNYTIILLPLILTVCLIAFLLFWLFLTLSFYSLAQAVPELNQLPYQHFKIPPLVVVALVISIFYLVWSFFLLMHVGKFIISGSLISWRFNRKDPYLSSSKIFLSSHIGSACLSSFLTSLFGLFKFQIDEAECAQTQQQPNKCASFCSKCFSCLCCCCIHFVFSCFHHAAMAYLNLSCLPYCQSSGQVSKLIQQQKASWSVVSLLYNIFNDLIPIIFAVGNMLFANFIIDTVDSYHNNTDNRVLLLVIIGLITYTVSQFYLAIYSEGTQSSFVLEQYHKRMPNQDKFPLRPLTEEEQQKKKPSSRLSKLN